MKVSNTGPDEVKGKKPGLPAFLLQLDLPDQLGPYHRHHHGKTSQDREADRGVDLQYTGQLYGVITINNTTATEFVITDTFGSQFDIPPGKL